MDIKDNETGLATELLSELKRQNKREHREKLVILVSYVLSMLLIVGGVIYICKNYNVSICSVNTNDGGNASFIGNDGDINNGTHQRSDVQEEERQAEGANYIHEKE